jgi:hypothetical protein
VFEVDGQLDWGSDTGEYLITLIAKHELALSNLEILLDAWRFRITKVKFRKILCIMLDTMVMVLYNIIL